MRGPLGAVIGKYPSSDGNGEVSSGDGIIKHNRKCRDVVFLVIFIAFWVAMIVNSSFGFNQGNPLSLSCKKVVIFVVFVDLWPGL
nr:choline transporter-like protein 2 [Ipomoea batatas]